MQHEAQSLSDEFEATFREALPTNLALQLLIEHGRKLCFQVLTRLSKSDFEPTEPVPYFQSQLEKAEGRLHSKGKATMRVDTAYETHLKLDNEYLRLHALTQQEYEERREAWKTGGPLPHNEKIHARLFPEMAQERHHRAKERQEHCEYWDDQMRKRPSKEVIAEMLSHIPAGAQDILSSVLPAKEQTNVKN